MIQNSLLEKLSDVWLSSQTDLAEVIRWGKYYEADPRLRKQTTDKHVVSLGIVGSIVLLHLREYYPYNESLMLMAIKNHDFPEGLKKKDTLFDEKTGSDDVDEYLIFKKAFGHLKPSVYEAYEMAYLLQFAEKCADVFPENAQQTMRMLRKKYPMETKLFPALESWEYLFYPHEQYRVHDNKVIMTHVLRNQVERLQAYSKVLPGFRQEVFTKELEEWSLDFMKQHEHIPSFADYFKQQKAAS